MNNNSSKNRSASKNNSTMEQMKYEIANEFGVSLGADATSRDNGSVGGEMTKRLVNLGAGRPINQSGTNSQSNQSGSNSQGNQNNQ